MQDRITYARSMAHPILPAFSAKIEEMHARSVESIARFNANEPKHGFLRTDVVTEVRESYFYRDVLVVSPFSILQDMRTTVATYHLKLRDDGTVVALPYY